MLTKIMDFIDISTKNVKIIWNLNVSMSNLCLSLPTSSFITFSMSVPSASDFCSSYLCLFLCINLAEISLK